MLLVGPHVTPTLFSQCIGSEGSIGASSRCHVQLLEPSVSQQANKKLYDRQTLFRALLLHMIGMRNGLCTLGSCAIST